jgi:phosphate-selective porin
MNARWERLTGLTLETPNKDFTIHVGTRLQEDTVFFTQSPGLRPPAQFGDLQDGTFFRRARIQTDGTFWEVFEWSTEFQFEQVREGIPQFDELFAGITKVPVLGTIRVGHQRVPQGLEGDQVSSSRAMTFLEKAPYTDAFYQNFAPGIWTGSSVLGEHLTWAAMVYRQELALPTPTAPTSATGNTRPAGA